MTIAFRPARCALCLAAALLLAAPGVPGADEPDSWIRVQTPNFTLFSNATQDLTLEIGRRLETFREVLARLNPRLEINSPLPTYIYVFKSYSSFGPYRKRFGRSAVSMDGYFVGHPHGNYVALNAAPTGEAFGPVYHEIVHYFVNNNFPHLPLWFNEGLAECYRTFAIDGNEAVIGRPVEGYAGWLRDHRMIRLADLFAIDADSKDYNEGEQQGIFYAQSWALVHYLIWGPPQWKSNLPAYLARLDRGEPLAALLDRAGYDAVEKDLAAYIKRGRLTFSAFDFDTLRAPGAAAVSTMPREEALYRLGDFLIHSDPGRAPEAEARFREAIRINPSHAAAHAGLGYILDTLGRHDEAAADYERALALDPDNYLTCYLYATSIMSGRFPPGITRGALSPGPAAALARARDLFARSIHLRPTIAEAYAGLGATYAFDTRDLSPGIAALEKARRMLPSRMDVVFNLVGLYARSGDRARAEELIDSVLRRGADRAMVEEARESLLQSDLQAAADFMDSQKYDDAVRALEKVLSATHDPRLKDQVEEQVRNIRETREKNRQIALYNQAAEKVSRSDFRGARDLLEQVVREATDPEIVRKAKRALAQIARALGQSESGGSERPRD